MLPSVPPDGTSRAWQRRSPMASPVTVAAACLEVQRDPQANLHAICRYIADAAARNVSLVVFPECVVQGYPHGLGQPDLDEYQYQLRAAQTVPGPATERIARVAAEHGLQVVVGLTETSIAPGEAGRLYNSTVLIDGGGVLARYRKVHTGGVEKCLWNRGSEWVVADSAAGRVGLLICYDLVFPEAARSLCLGGAQLLVMSTAWGDSAEPTFARGYDLFTRCRALENQVFLVSANLAGGAGLGFLGDSRIVDPRGQIMAETKGPGLAIAAIDIEMDLCEARAKSWYGQVFLKDREPASYKLS
jgi:predicted amidohydrolase